MLRYRTLLHLSDMDCGISQVSSVFRVLYMITLYLVFCTRSLRLSISNAKTLRASLEIDDSAVH